MNAERGRASIGNNSILGDIRWAGYYGVDADYIASDNCKICSFLASDVKVCGLDLDSMLRLHNHGVWLAEMQ